jgi:4-amino-4-deoxy-L-arabinose transferase-like glycosyltransferase
MTVSVLITATLGFFFLASRANEPQKGSYYCLSYACAALGVLAKGLIGAGLPAAVILCSIVLHKRWGIVKEMRLLRGMCLFVLLCAPWFILVSIRNPGFLHRFFIYEHLGRYLRPDKEPSSPLFYVPVLLGLMFPWSCFIPAAVTRAVKGWKAENGECRLFLWLWALIIFCFFSASSTRLIPYVLPVFPAVALLLGDAVSGVFDRGFKPIRLQAYAAIIIMIIGGIGIMLYPHVATHPRLRARDCIPIGALALAEALFCLLAARRRDAVKFFLIMCALSYLLVIVGPHEVKENILKARSVKKLALIVREKAGPNDIVACYDWYDHEFPFYARRRIISVGHMGELEFGSAQGDQSAWFMSPGRFIDLWDSARQVFVLINEDDIPDFRNSVKRHPRMLGHEAKVMLVTNR